MAHKVYRYFYHLFFGESLKLDIVWDHTVNMKFNVFYTTFTYVFYSCHVFTFLTFFYFNRNVFYIYVTICLLTGRRSARSDQLMGVILKVSVQKEWHIVSTVWAIICVMYPVLSFWITP